LSHPDLGHLYCPGNLFLGPSKAVEPDNNTVSVCFLPGTDISDPCVDCLLGDTQFFCQGSFGLIAFFTNRSAGFFLVV
jgi:hypothetical protein